LFITEINHTEWNAENEKTYESKTVFSGQQFDEQGNLIYQLSTSKNMLKPQNPDVVHELNYDYEPQN
jgi:hypothetical protein